MKKLDGLLKHEVVDDARRSVSRAKTKKKEEEGEKGQKVAVEIIPPLDKLAKAPDPAQKEHANEAEEKEEGKRKTNVPIESG